MFERYTEKARRVIFFARYEASQYGSPYIETEHLLLGVLREDKALTNRFLKSGEPLQSIRNKIEAHTTIREKVSTSVDLPLSNESKRVLKYAAHEADRLGHKYIGTQHLLLGLLCEKDSFAAALLREQGLTLEELRTEIANSPEDLQSAFRTFPKLRQTGIEIHGFPMDAAYILEQVRACRNAHWHWRREIWRPRDLAISKDGKVSFDVSLAADTDNFELRKGGWKKDRCTICRWELYESDDPQHAVGYTNGREWVCMECHEKFLQETDYFAREHP